MSKISLIGRQKTIQPPSIRFPGPGAYDPSAEIVMNKSPHFSMGTKFSILPMDNFYLQSVIPIFFFQNIAPTIFQLEYFS